MIEFVSSFFVIVLLKNRISVPVSPQSTKIRTWGRLVGLSIENQARDHRVQ